MPWVRFKDDFDWRAGQQVTAYKSGMESLVTTPCANAAIEAGKAEKIKAPKGRAGDATGPDEA